jgi:hypothetical protein
MTFTFHTYHDGAEVYIDPPSATELAGYQNDSRHAAEQLRAYRSRKLRASIRYSLTSILSRLTLGNSTISVLLGFSLFAAHTFFV